MQEFINWLKAFSAGTGFNIVTSLVVFFAGLTAARLISRISRVYLQKTSIESTTISFIISIINFVLYMILAFLCISIVFPKASTEMIALLGTAAIAIGLALQGSLGNFASGIIIIFTKPFREGDYVDIGTASGVIKSIGLLHTEILSTNNQKIVIGNSNVINSTIINYNAKPTRRLDLKFSAANVDDVEEVKKILLGIAKKHKKILKTPEPLVRLYGLNEGALVFVFRAWVNTSDYWSVYYDINEAVYIAFEEKKINLPYKKMGLVLSNKEEDKQQ